LRRPVPLLSPYTTLFRSAHRAGGHVLDVLPFAGALIPRMHVHEADADVLAAAAEAEAGHREQRAYVVLLVLEEVLFNLLEHLERSEEHTSELQSRENLVC